MFTEQLPNLLDYVNSLPGHVCLVGDMNIHFDNPLQSLTKQTLSTLSLYGLVQVINKPTHRCGGGGGVDPIPCVSTHRISDPRSGPPSFSPHTSSSAATPTGSVHKSQTVSVVGMSGQLKRCNESWFGSLQKWTVCCWVVGRVYFV